MGSKTRLFLLLGLSGAAAGVLVSCSGTGKVQAKDPGEPGASPAGVSVGVVKVIRKNVGRTLTVSSELVPFQEIDVFAKESGFVKDLNVDYGSRVQKDQVLATLEIPELQLQVKEDDAAVKNAEAQIPHAQEELNRVQAQQKVFQLQYDRLNGVANSKPGLVAQQEVDDSQGKALASAAQVEAAKSNLQSAESVLAATEAKREHDQALFDYAKITAPFAGVVTQRLRESRHADASGHQLQHAGHAVGQALPGRPVPAGDSGARVLREIYPSGRSGQRQRSVAEPNVSWQSGPVLRGCSRRHAHHAHRGGRAESPAAFCFRACMRKLRSRSKRKTPPSRSPSRRWIRTTTRQVLTWWIHPAKSSAGRSCSASRPRPTPKFFLDCRRVRRVVVSDRSGLKAGQPVQPKLINLMQYQGSEEQH